MRGNNKRRKDTIYSLKSNTLAKDKIFNYKIYIEFFSWRSLSTQTKTPLGDGVASEVKDKNIFLIRDLFQLGY